MFLALSQIKAQKIEEIRYKNILKQLKVDHFKIKEELSIEKKMPNKEDSYIIVIPVVYGLDDHDGFNVNVIVLITDGNGTIKNKFIDPEEYVSDAVMLKSFTVDTGLYYLNPNIRAFGITANYRNGSGPNPYSSSTISMYYPDGKTLKNVLNQFQISSYGGEWDMKCAGEFIENGSVILLTKEKTNGFANLKIKTKITQIKSRMNGEECTDRENTKISYKILKFNNSRYR